MAGYLLLWNPDNREYDEWSNLPDMVAQVKRGKKALDSWKVRSIRKYVPGDRVYILKVGRGVRGIMGSGTFMRPDNESSIAFRYDALLNPDKTQILAREYLQKKVPTISWSPQASGICLYADAAKVESLWRKHLRHVNSTGLGLAKFIAGLPKYSEGWAGITPQTVTNEIQRRNTHAPVLTTSNVSCANLISRNDTGKSAGNLYTSTTSS